MFEVYDKRTLEAYKVYSINNDKNGYPHFLIKKDKQWLWKSAKNFITVEEYHYNRENESMRDKEDWIKCLKISDTLTPRCMYLRDGKWCTRKECPFSN